MRIIERADKTQNAAGSGGNARINSLSRRRRLPSSGLGSAQAFPRGSRILGCLHRSPFSTFSACRPDGPRGWAVCRQSTLPANLWTRSGGSFLCGAENLICCGSIPEIILFAAVWTFWLSLRKSGIRYAFVFIYVLIFLYYLYEGVTFTFFSVEPVFYAQLRMATEGFSFFLENARVTTAVVAGTVLFIVGGAVLVARLARYVLPDSGPGPFSRAMLGLLAAIVVIQAIFFPDRISRPEWCSAVSSPKQLETLANPSACMTV